MKQVLGYLKEHRRICLLISGLYIIFFISMHKTAQQPFFWIVAWKDQFYLNKIMTLISAGLFLTLLFCIVIKIRTHLKKRLLSIYWIWTLILSLISFEYVMPYKSEMAHFPQFALMAILLCPLFESYFVAFCTSILFGVIDETYQFVISGSLYLDFNDMLLNILGSALGILIVKTFYPNFIQNRKLHLRDWTPYGILLLSGLILFILYFVGVVTHFYDQGQNYFLVRHDTLTYDPSFWYTVEWGIWHQFRPVEGIVAVLLLPLTYFRIDI